MQEVISKNVGMNQRSKSNSELALHDLVELAKQHGELYPILLEILKHYGVILRKDIGL
jgi:diaphanous 1